MREAMLAVLGAVLGAATMAMLACGKDDRACGEHSETNAKLREKGEK